jgi:hypothetical protein
MNASQIIKLLFTIMPYAILDAYPFRHFSEKNLCVTNL